VWPAVAVSFLYFLGVGATLPALPGAVRELGGGGTELGVVLGVFPFAALAGRFLSGRSTDRRGRRFTVRAGLAVTAVSGLLFALPLPLAGLVTARLLHGLADALIYTATATWVLDRSADDRRAQRLALLGSGIWGGYALGPLLGAVLDLRTVGLVVLGTAMVALLSPLGREAAVAPAAGPGGLRGLVPVGVSVPGLSLGLGNLAYAVLVGFLVLHVDDRGGQGAVALASFSAAVLAGRLIAVPLAARVGILRTLPPALLVMAAGLVVIAFSSGTLVPAVAAAVIGVGYCLPFPALATLVTGRVPAAQRGAAIGALTAYYDIFVGVGSLAAGVLADLAGVPSVFLAAAVGVLGAAAINLGLARGQARAARVDAEVVA